LFTPEERKLIDRLVDAVAAADQATCPYCRQPISRLAVADHLATCPDRPEASTPPIAPVVRASRFELVDDDGKVRAVVGKMSGLDGRGFPMYGLSLRDHRDRERVWLAVDGNGPILGFDQAGNGVLQIGVNDDDSDVSLTGPYLSFCDPAGNEVVRWGVAPDGTLEIDQREQPGS
jgi:hypothetical protein